MEFVTKIERELEADVVVVGGGTSGVFAAISAAKTGAKTILVEKNSVLGGTMTVANVNFPGLFFAWGKQIISGPCWESIERTIALGGAQMPEISFKPVKHWHEQIRLNRFVYINVLFEMCKEAGVEIICNSMISDIIRDNNYLKLIVTDKNGLCLIKTKTAVDATGDATLTQLAGYPVEKSPKQQPATLQNHISGYDLDEGIEEEIREKFDTANLPEYITANRVIDFLRINKIDMHIPCVDADTSQGKTRLEQRAFSQTLSLYKFLRRTSFLADSQIQSNRTDHRHIIRRPALLHIAQLHGIQRRLYLGINGLRAADAGSIDLLITQCAQRHSAVFQNICLLFQLREGIDTAVGHQSAVCHLKGYAEMLRAEGILHPQKQV